MHFIGTNLQGVNRALNSLPRQTPRGSKPFSETHDTGKGIDNAKTIGLGTGDKQAAAVGAKIKGGEILTISITNLASPPGQTKRAANICVSGHRPHLPKGPET